MFMFSPCRPCCDPKIGVFDFVAAFSALGLYGQQVSPAYPENLGGYQFFNATSSTPPIGGLPATDDLLAAMDECDIIFALDFSTHTSFHSKIAEWVEEGGRFWLVTPDDAPTYANSVLGGIGSTMSVTGAEAYSDTKSCPPSSGRWQLVPLDVPFTENIDDFSHRRLLGPIGSPEPYQPMHTVVAGGTPIGTSTLGDVVFAGESKGDGYIFICHYSLLDNTCENQNVIIGDNFRNLDELL